MFRLSLLADQKSAKRVLLFPIFGENKNHQFPIHQFKRHQDSAKNKL
jgi:hypothetical protein